MNKYILEILFFIVMIWIAITFSKQPEISSPHYFVWIFQLNFLITWNLILFVGMVILKKMDKKE